MSSEYKIWKDIEERFKFCLMLAVLCACGYLVWHKLPYFILILIFGGIAAAMVPLYQISQEKLEELQYLDEGELTEAIHTIEKAKQIIMEYQFDNPFVASQLAQFDTYLQRENLTAQTFYREQYQERKRYEADQHAQYQKREAELIEERQRKGVSYGAPPHPITNLCPADFPIRATENLRREMGETRRGIYYFPDEADYNSKASWCFDCAEHAERDGYGRSRKGQPKHPRRQ
ncbi:MAG: hypothetical protein AAF282_03390 [Cyanobacteria bacterium P01_A01_bin.15]